MKQTVEGQELWTVKDVLTSHIPNDEVFKIKVSELRKLHNRHVDVLMELKQAQMQNELYKLELKELRSQLKTDTNRFIVYA